jgi:hypothetical protein
MNLMIRRAALPSFSGLVLALAASAFAQTAPEADAGRAPAAKAPAPHRRAISSETAAQLSALTPKYAPPPPKPAAKPEEEQIDLREVDKPKNGIVRLPKYVVQEPKPLVLTERAVNTQKGLTDIAVRRYISEVDRALNRFTLPLFGTSAEARALEMYAEDERLKNMTDLRDNAIDAAKTDPGQGQYIRREAQRTYMRAGDFGWQNNNK